MALRIRLGPRRPKITLAAKPQPGIVVSLPDIRKRPNFCHLCRQLVPTFTQTGWWFDLYIEHERCGICRAAVGYEAYLYARRRFAPVKKKPEVIGDEILLDAEDE